MLIAEFLDTFYGALKLDRQAALSRIADEPQALLDPQQHALLGVICEHLSRRWELGTIPAWSIDPTRFLSRPYFLTNLQEFKAMMIAQSPLAFRRRLIFKEAEPLRRARMPRVAAPRR